MQDPGWKEEEHGSHGENSVWSRSPILFPENLKEAECGSGILPVMLVRKVVESGYVESLTSQSGWGTVHGMLARMLRQK